MPVVVFACTLDTHAFESLLPFATALLRRGARVHFLADASWRTRIQAAGIEFAPMRDVDDPEDVDDASVPRRTDVATRLLVFERTIRRRHVDRLAGQHASLQSLLASLSRQYPDEPAPVLVHDTMFLGAWPLLLGAEGIRPAAILSIGVMPLPATDEFLAPFGLGLPPDRSEAGRQVYAAMNAQLRELFSGTQAALERTLRRCGAVQPAPFVLDGMLTLPHRFLQLSIAPLEHERAHAPSTLRYIGLAPPLPGSSLLPWWWPDLDTARPVIFLDAGRLPGGRLDPLVPTTLSALGREPVLIIVGVEWDAARFGPLPVNARAAGELPPEALLPWVDVMVSDGRYANVQRALSQGIPVVLAAGTESARELAARVTRFGAGIQLPTPASPENIQAAVRAVSESVRFLAAAHRLREAYQHHDALQAVAAAVEEAVAGALGHAPSAAAPAQGTPQPP